MLVPSLYVDHQENVLLSGVPFVFRRNVYFRIVLNVHLVLYQQDFFYVRRSVFESNSLLLYFVLLTFVVIV